MKDLKERNEEAINKDYLYTIREKDDILVTNELKIKKDEKIKELLDKYCNYLDNEKNVAKIIYYYYILKDNIKNIDELFFREHEYVEEMNSSYNRFQLREINHFIFSSNNEKIIEKKELQEYLYNLFIAYSHKKTIESLDSSIDRAYSHRLPGWQDFEFVLDEDFKIIIKTNFGYGRSSYFHLIISYKDIKIIPYTKIIYYYGVNASEMINYTDDYELEDDSWKKCFDFVVKVRNNFHYYGKNTFIKQNITKSIEDLCDLVDKILHNNVFYFIDIRRIDNYLDLNSKKIVYDYEHLLHNKNKSLINKEDLKKLVNLLKQTKGGERIYSNIIRGYNSILQNAEVFLLNYIRLCEKEEKKVDENLLYELLLLFADYKENDILKSDTNKDMYCYAVAMILSKYYEFDDQEKNFELQSTVKKILGIDNNYKLLLYMYSGFNLIEFRNQKIDGCYKLFDSISSLNELINTKKYIDILKNSIGDLRNQNIDFNLQLIEKEKMMNTQHDEIKREYEEKLSEFKQSATYKEHEYYEKLFNKLSKVFECIHYSAKENRITLKEDIIKEIDLLQKHNCDEKTGVFFELWSKSAAKMIRDDSRNVLRKKESPIDSLKFNLLNMEISRIMCFLSDYFIKFNDNKIDEKMVKNNYEKIYDCFKQLKISAKPPESYLKKCMEYNNDYINVQKKYDESMKPITKLKERISKIESEISNVLNQEEQIKNWNKNIDEMLQYKVS